MINVSKTMSMILFAVAAFFVLRFAMKKGKQVLS